MSETSREGIIVGRGRDPHALQSAVDPKRNLTAEQAAVVGSGGGPMLVVAGAGSGKTETLSMRILYLLDNARELFGTDISPDQILCLTFTRKATAELAERSSERIAHVFGKDPARPEVHVSTYNGYAASLVADHGLRVGIDPSSTVLTNAALWQLADSLVQGWPDAVDTDAAVSSVTVAIPRLAAQLRDHQLTTTELISWCEEALTYFSNLPSAKPKGETGQLSGDAAAVASKIRSLASLALLVDEFERRKREGSAIDFADQVAIAVQLAQLPHVREVEAAKYRAVLLDEFQDTSPPQLELFASLFGQSHPVMAVGDPNQAIYGFRGASAEALTQFVEQFGTVTPVEQRTLSVSWRNEAAILDVANQVVSGLNNGGITFAPLRSKGAELQLAEPVRTAPGVTASRFDSAEEEADAVAAFLLARRAELGHSDSQPVTAAVLCRRRSQYEVIANALAANDIPFEIVGLGGLIDEPELADLLALLEVAHDPSRGDSLMRLLSGERLAIGPSDLMALNDLAEEIAGPRRHREGSPSIADALQELPAEDWVSRHGRTFTPPARVRFTALAAVIDSIRRHTYLSVPELISFTERAWALDIETAVARPWTHGQRAIDAFVDASRRFVAGAEHATLGAFLAWLEAARREENGLDAPVREPDPVAVQLLTVHGSKGLEWDVVVVPGMNDGQFPSITAPSKSDANYRDKGWISELGEIPFELRRDRGRLPKLDYTQASDTSQLTKSVAEFAIATGRYVLTEERRLFYVALTRARSHVLLSGSWYAGGKTLRTPSLYVEELRQLGAVTQADWSTDPPSTAPESDHQRAGIWPREATPAQAIRRELAAQVDATRDPQPAASAPLVKEVTAMLKERAERSAKAPGLPSHLSTSAVVALRRDRETFMSQLLRPMPQEPTSAAHRGQTLHLWIERQFGHASLLDVESLDFGDLGPGEETDSDLDRLKRTFAASEWANRTPVAIEVDIEMPIVGTAIRSRIDAVFPAGSGLDKVTVVDWKSGRPPTDPTEKAAREVQLAVYRLAWSRMKGIPIADVDAAFYYVAADATVRPEHLLTEEEIEELLAGRES